MSSEMREVDQLGFALQRLLTPKQWEQEAITDRLNAIRALLARTEAGADGAAVAWRVEWDEDNDGDAFYVTLDTERGAMGRANEAIAEGYKGVRVRRLVYGDTHPQDASGDAEFSADELESLAKCVLASVTPGGFHIPEGWNVLLDKLTAMQAKEAR